MLTGKDLFEGETVYEILESRKKFAKADYRRAKFNQLPKETFDLKISASKNLVGVMQQLLQENPSERYRDLHQLLRALHPFTRADIPRSSLARQSYRRSMAVNKSLIRDFYQAFTAQHTPAQSDFSRLGKQRQSAMLQMAVDVLLDIDEKGDLLKSIAGSNNHSKYQTADFSLFLDVLIATIQQNDPQWTESEAAEWQTIREKALTLLETR
jgi:hypothetical protein